MDSHASPAGFTLASVYTFVALGVHQRVTLVIHDWGPGFGFDWANRHRDAV
jgi:haloalkane dehalogenase